MTTEARIPITIEVAPDGILVTVSYDGTLASIPATIERLRREGITDLVQASRGTHTAPLSSARRPAAPRVEPSYDGNGNPMCPVHRKALSEGRYGLFCSSKAKPGDEQNDKGYCSLKFE